MDKVKAWIKKHKALTGAIIAIFTVLIYFIYSKTSTGGEGQAANFVYAPPSGGGTDSGGSGGSGGVSTADTTSLLNSFGEMFTAIQNQNEKFYQGIQDQNENFFDAITKRIENQNDNIANITSQLTKVSFSDVEEKSEPRVKEAKEAKKGFDLAGFIDDTIDNIKELQGNWSGASKSEQTSIHSEAQSLRHTIAGTIDKKGQGSGYSYDWKMNKQSGYNELVVTDDKGKKTVI